MLGPLLGAAVLAVADWRAIFWLNVVLGVVLAAAIRVTGGSPSRRSTRPGPATALGVLAFVLGLLTLLAPARLTTGVTTGIPFIPLVGSSRVATPIGVLTLALVGVLAAVTGRRWWPVLRAADAPGAVLVAVALGSLVLTFASADPEREVVGPSGLVLLPVGAAAVVLYLWHARTAAHPLVAARRRPWPGAGRPAGQPPRRCGPGDRRRRRAAARPADPDRLADHGRPGAGAVPGRGARRRPARRCAAAAARPRRGRRAGPGARRGRARRHGDLGPGLARGGARHGGAGRWSDSAPAWPSPRSTPPRSPTPRRRPTVSPARWSSSPAWSAWWWGWPC